MGLGEVVPAVGKTAILLQMRWKLPTLGSVQEV